MALMKKDKQQPEQQQPPVEAAEEPQELAAGNGPEPDAVSADDSTMTALASPDEPEPEAAGEGLLDMFTTVGIQTVDRSALLALTPEVDMVDLVSELNLVASALGIVQSERTSHGTEEELQEEAAA